MSSTSRTLKRLGVGSVGVCTLLATPYLGAVANAAAPSANTPATINIASQTTNTGSTRNDGTNTTVKISATTTPAGSGQPTISGVRFSYQSTVAGSAPVVIGTDTTAPYSIEWAPPASGTYSEIAEALDSTGTTVATNTKTPVAVSDLSSVHISAPADGASIGSFGGKIIVSGTRSVDLPALSITAQTRDNSSGTLTGAGTATTVAAGTPAAGADQTYSVAVVAPACVNSVTAGDCNVVITAVATGATVNGSSDEVAEAKLYAQTLTNLTVTPATASQPVNSPQTFTVTASDQNSKPIAGLDVNVTDNTTASEVPAAGTTGADGTFKFVGQDSAAETTTYSVKSAVGGGATFDPAVDFTRTATLTTYTSNPTTLTLSAAPAKTVYASQSEYTNSNPAAFGTPVVDVCVVDQNGNGTPNSATAPLATVTRTTTTNGVTAAPVTTSVTPTADTRTGKTNCYVVPHAAATGFDYGQDVFNVYFEKNGTPGFQAGSTDVGAAPLTLKFASLNITTNDTQAQQGTSTNVAFTVKGLDGTPFTGRKIALSLSGTDATFPTTQPAGTTYTGPGAATCLTDANGVCNVTLNDTTAGADTVTATDSITDATLNQIATNASVTSNVDVRATSVTLAKVVQLSSTVTQPTAAAAPGTVAQPGDAVKIVEQLRDSTGGVLKGVSTTVTLDHGFFTPDCTSTTYSSCTFEPAIANNAPVGNLKDSGAMKSVTSDNAGNITFTVGIKRDAGFDDDGIVALNNTVVGNGATVVNGPANPNSGTTLFTKFTTDGQTPGGTITGAYNGASVKIVANSAADKLSGDVQLPAGTTFYVTALDQFGNLVRTTTAGAISLTASGLGTLTKNTTIGSYAKAIDPITLKSTTTSFAGDSSTVTATWAAPVTTFQVTPGVAPVTTSTNSVNPTTTANKTDSFTVNLYVVDSKNLQYTFASTPGNTVPINTAVTTSVTVKDQKGNPVAGQPVKFLRSGPNDAAGNSQIGGTTGTVFTGPAGQVGTSYSSGTPGTATVTVIVTDGSGNELSRGVQNVTFTKGTPTTGPISIATADGGPLAGAKTNLTVTGTPGAQYNVFAANRPSSTFVLAHQGTLDVNGQDVFEVHPVNNVNFIASANGVSSTQIIMSVHTALNIAVKYHGHVATFYGQIYPNNRAQAIYIKIVDGSYRGTIVGQATRDASGKNWTFTKDFRAQAGQTLKFFSATASDTQNANGHSVNLKTTIQ